MLSSNEALKELKTKHDINQQDLKIVNLHFVTSRGGGIPIKGR